MAFQGQEQDLHPLLSEQWPQACLHLFFCQRRSLGPSRHYGMTVSKARPSLKGCEHVKLVPPGPFLCLSLPVRLLNQARVRSASSLRWPWQGAPAPPRWGFPLSAFLVCLISGAPDKPQCGKALESRNRPFILWPSLASETPFQVCWWDCLPWGDLVR